MYAITFHEHEVVKRVANPLHKPPQWNFKIGCSASHASRLTRYSAQYASCSARLRSSSSRLAFALSASSFSSARISSNASPCYSHPPVKQSAGRMERISTIVPNVTLSTCNAAEPSGWFSNVPFSGPCAQIRNSSDGLPAGTVNVAVSVPMPEMPVSAVRFQKNSPTSA